MSDEASAGNQAAIADPANGGEGDSQAIEGSEGSTQKQEGNDLGVKDLPPELQEKEKELVKAFHEKTQALAAEKKQLLGETEKYKADAKALYDLAGQEWFKKAVEAEKALRSGAQQELSDEAFEAVKNDKRAFQDLLAQRDRAVTDRLRGEFKVEFDKLSKSQQEFLTDREFNATAKDYGDEFVRANKAGMLDAYLDKGLDYETAYKLHMQDQGKVAKKVGAEPLSGAKRSGVVEKGGLNSVRGGPVVKVRSLNDALDRALDLAARGTKDYRLERE